MEAIGGEISVKVESKVRVESPWRGSRDVSGSLPEVFVRSCASLCIPVCDIPSVSLSQ